MENKLPITRLSKFFSHDDLELHVQIGCEYLHGDLNMKLVLYQVDRLHTDNNSIYAEAGKDKTVFKLPVEINAIVKIDEPKNVTYKNGLMRYNEPGNLTFSIYIKHLEELNADIKYGDYIGYPDDENKLRYYTVVNDGSVTSDNKHKMFGTVPFYRTITCVPAQESEFRGI